MANNFDHLQFFNILESQKRILISEHLYPESGINNICATYIMPLPDLPGLLEQAIHHVLSHSQAINLRLSLDQGRLRQYYFPYQAQIGELLDFSDPAGPAREEAWLRECARTHMAYIDAPLFYWAMFYNSQGQFAFLLKTHHAVSDAWTHQLLATRIVESYQSLLAGKGLPVINEAPYLDQIEAEANYLQSAQCQKHKDFWRSQLFPLPDSLGISSKSTSPSAKAQRYQLQFSHAESQQIDAYLEKNGLGPAQFFMNALVVLLFRMFRRPEFLLAVLTHNRIGKAEKTMTGMFVNTLVMRLSLTGQETLPELSKKLELQMTALLRHQRLPFSLLRDLDPQGANVFPAIEVVYNYDKVVPNIDCAQHFSQAENFPLMVRASRRVSDQPYAIDLDYRLDSLSAEQIATFGDCFRRIVDKLAQGSPKTIAEMQWIPDEIRDQVLYRFNDTAYPNPFENTLPNIFEAMVSQRPQAQAVSDDRESLSYGELNQRANQLARVLLDYPGPADQPVAVLLQRSVRMMIVLLAILKTGRPYMPLLPEFPTKRLEAMLADSQCQVLVSEGSLADQLQWPGTVLNLDSLSYADRPSQNLGRCDDPRGLAYILYTSGSTGTPKGVMLEHRSVLNRLFWLKRCYPLIDADVILQKTPYTFDVSVWELFGWFFAGARLHFLRPGGEKEPQTIVQAIQAQLISTIHFVPSMLAVFLEYLEQGGGIQALASLATVSCSGEALQAKHVAMFRRLITDRFGTRLYNLYGPTEAAIDVTFHDCSADESESVSIGRPIDNVQILILDEYGQVLPPGLPGELHIGGVCLARGYRGRPELNAEKFVPHPYQADQRLYRSGDLASWNEDGSIKYLGRLDFQVKIRGNRVEIGEIENALLKIADIREAAVLALSDQNNQTYLGAYIVADRLIDHQSIRHFLKLELPSYMVPTYITQLPQFPLNPSGKLDRKALPQPQPNSLTGRSFVAPRNEVEEKIGAVWEEVLHCEGIGIHDNFFDIGGDSLSLIQVLGKLQSDYELSLQDLFDYPTIGSLAEHCHTKLKPSLGVLSPVAPAAESDLAKIWDYQQDLFRRGPPQLAQEQLTPCVFITGATGFLGAHLVHELLINSTCSLVLLVRGETQTDCALRFANRYAHYFGPNELPSRRDRIEIVNGDLTKPRFGLSADQWQGLAQRCDLVVHGAADVRHYGRSSDFEQTNIDGTRRIVELCHSGRAKSLHFLSTVSLALATAQTGHYRAFCESDAATGLNTPNLYLQSKIETEQLLAREAPQARIHRLGNICNNSGSGVFQVNPGNNAFVQSLRRYREIGSMPAIATRFVDFSFVDQCAQALRHLILNPDCPAGVYHIINPIRYSLVEIAALAGLPAVEPASFLADLPLGDELRLHAPYLDKPELLNVFIYSDKTVDILKKAGFSWGQLSQTLLNKLSTVAEVPGPTLTQSDIRYTAKEIQ